MNEEKRKFSSLTRFAAVFFSAHLSVADKEVSEDPLEESLHCCLGKINASFLEGRIYHLQTLTYAILWNIGVRR